MKSELLTYYVFPALPVKGQLELLAFRNNYCILRARVLLTDLVPLM